jgi:hypothetical protein
LQWGTIIFRNEGMGKGHKIKEKERRKKEEKYGIITEVF